MEDNEGGEASSFDALYKVNLVPSEIFLKFRKEIQGLRVGVNIELYNAPHVNDCHAKLVLKPLAHTQKWKFIYEPLWQEVQLVSKKISLTRFLLFQVGVSHSFYYHETGWKWKVTSSLGTDRTTRIYNKTSLGLCPGVDFRFGWRADYSLPEFSGGLGSDEPVFNMKSGRLELALDRVEGVFTHADQQ